MDVKTAFLNGHLNIPVYMEIPDGIEYATELKRKKICKLEKALYGLKVSPKCWNEKFTETVKKFGLTGCHTQFLPRQKYLKLNK